ncbi:peptidoglycan bridge formation glycyltransferase FemA/FemB family protein [Anaerosacchariphilus polymeriproducens]|uniref:Peptidoglycan bridge formation glycyltransferase FemA/FemB family protein n=1 Tax=Anaerosacchariphilus polymeriproducens TaxID=1812858 RepID=A0A371AZ05_9FIRM|nr:peptidoglycan bridge formation glycyltransferase FemA/FemB family protein [Anaerosacchariphilus polymeriproducens]RDU24779.1 peptidoglycan bridge formation glycyltransferase FemA/FemB family protein [Anaerosacchariphilus polymeriproducens]
MIKVNDRIKKGIKILDIYYAKENSGYRGYDIIQFFQNQQYYPGAKTFKTIIIDLLKNEDSLFKEFNKSLRRAIRRVEEQDRIDFFCYLEPSNEQIHEYVQYFNEFAEAKNIYTCDEPLLNSLAEIGCLRIVGARSKESGEVLVYNTFIQDKIRARGQFSASLSYKYSDNKEKRNFIADANKALEWYTIKMYKNDGYKEYDLGGVTLDPDRPEMNGIDQYKMQFGGKVVEEYNYTCTFTFKGKIAFFLKELKNKIIKH